ncbi:DEAD/DEAH box helicase [Leptospira wolffii]|uniref:DEAD/DEAH box helicase n=1 Tax=Leptospira wolffii TaxID=409998 RepID=A0ABV5BRS2_9LEPT|nr:DEAD/DEAH box helicase [Leptospira wolffii]EPG66171.1 putative ATP-dependent RNA helicase RhlE [Leptospira wolffii serovar Khorat str. Khorat-H2]TGL50494.1 DEAD/DEAH box helicase [Leptospira wolffii]
MKFQELTLEPNLQKAIQDAGFVELTPIQEKAIPHGIEGKDVTGLAQTGTGKTVAFLVPIIHNILSKGITGVSTLILAPTRELVIQIAEEAQKLLKYSEHRVVPIIGGTDYKTQNRDLEGLNGLIVATPGRLIDLARSGTADLDKVEFLVLDEADRMLDMGFIHDIRWLLHKCKNRKQTLLFSATLSVEVMRLAYRFMNEPVEIQINPDKLITERIDQKLVHLGREEKMPYMVNTIIAQEMEGQGIIFTNFKVNIPKIVYSLRKYGIPVTGISSDLDQKKRLRLMRDFKSGRFKFMVATDVASRGIDVENIEVVFNFDLPQDTENYVHRIGRTARAGRVGKSISFCSESDYVELEKIEKYLKQKIDVLPVEEELLSFPSGEFQAFIGGDAYDSSPSERNGNSRGGRDFQSKKNNRRDSGSGNSRGEKNWKKDSGREGGREGNRDSRPGKQKFDKKKRPEAAIQEAQEFLQKADTVFGASKDRKDQNQKNNRKKGKQRQDRPRDNTHAQQDRRHNKPNDKYDKKKRNLFDINDSKSKPNKKKDSLWQKITSFFRR